MIARSHSDRDGGPSALAIDPRELEEEQKMICFHHNDLDGRCAAYWVRRLCPSAELYEIDYKDEFPLAIALQYAEVWLVDYSVPTDTLVKLACRTVVWIDHHKTALDRFQREVVEANIPLHVPGLREDGIAACVLTYLYTQTPDNLDGVAVGADCAPLATRLIGDRDVWRFQYGEATREFCAGLLAHDTNPRARLWDYLNWDASPGVREMREEGKIVMAYRRWQHADKVKALAFETVFEGHRALACNNGLCGSEFFGHKAEQYDLLMPFYFDGATWTVSLYSVKGVDCAEIAKRHGGGGHKGAAGFQCAALPFVKTRPVGVVA